MWLFEHDVARGPRVIQVVAAQSFPSDRAETIVRDNAIRKSAASSTSNEDPS